MTLFLPATRRRVLSLMPTYQCTAACTHCGTLSHPKDYTKLSREQLFSAIDQAAASAYDMVVFTGGEATLSKHLFDGIRYATQHKLATRLVTNGWWGKAQHSRTRMLTNLKEAGLTEINLSTGDEHSKFVPVETVATCAYSAVEAELTTAIMIEVRQKRRVTEATFRALPKIQDLYSHFRPGLFRIIESPWMPLDGNSFEDYEAEQLVNRENVRARGGCDSVLKTTTIQADGQISACCGIGVRLIPELQLGYVGEMSLSEADQAAENDFLKRWLRAEGPEKILAWASEVDPDIHWENMYAHRCQACIRLYKDPKVRKVVLEQYETKMVDVLFTEWLLYDYKGDLNSEPAESYFDHDN